MLPEISLRNLSELCVSAVIKYQIHSPQRRRGRQGIAENEKLRGMSVPLT